MALQADGSINRKKIVRELVDALEDDIKYTKTDEMKKRAIRTARNYDEFKNLVACATLKPVSREDIESLRKAKKGWANSKSVGQQKSKSTSVSDATSKLASLGLGIGGGAGSNSNRSSGSVPKSALEFDRDWRRIKGGVGGADGMRATTREEERYKCLQRIGPAHLRKCFATEMPSELMEDILAVLVYTEEQVQQQEEGALQDDRRIEILAMLSCLPETGRFDLNLALLSKGQKEVAARLVQRLEEKLLSKATRKDEQGPEVNDEAEEMEVVVPNSTSDFAGEVTVDDRRRIMEEQFNRVKKAFGSSNSTR